MTARADWYKDAIIYEVHVRAFRDSNGDGTGDFDTGVLTVTINAVTNSKVKLQAGSIVFGVA